jgi:hypothetical protein
MANHSAKKVRALGDCVPRRHGWEKNLEVLERKKNVSINFLSEVRCMFRGI